MEIKVQTDKKIRKELRTIKSPGKKNILELDERVKPVHKETLNHSLTKSLTLGLSCKNFPENCQFVLAFAFFVRISQEPIQ